jgi:hypothetical protein
MTRLFKRISPRSAAVCLLLSVGALAQVPNLRISNRERTIHIFPRVQDVMGDRMSAGLAGHNGGTPPLTYHGGPVMLTHTLYAIFWKPPKLQNGAATSMSARYQPLMTSLLTEYPGHSLAAINTQYYQTVGTTTTYIKNQGSFGGSYVDTAAYPPGGCPVASRNCLTDTQIRNEIKKVMGIKGWTGGLNKMFLLFTSSGEASCFDAAGTQCSTNAFCAYHSHFLNAASQHVIYTNEPYGNPINCQAPGAPSPNGDAVADAAATAASHEISEAITDPLLNAWYDSSGFENGDECAYTYGRLGWGSGKANEKWDGKLFLLQTEYDNQLSGFYISDPNFAGCFNAGPEL